MKNASLALALSLVIVGCGGRVETTPDNGNTNGGLPSVDHGTTSPDEPTRPNQKPTYVCDANPAIEVEVMGALDMSTSIVVGGPVTKVTIITHCDVILKRLRFRIRGADTNQFVVGTKGTDYFTNWRVMNAASDTVMGPIEFSNTLAAGSLDSGLMTFSDEFSISQSDGTLFNLNAMFSQTEDAPGQFKHGDKLFFVYWNDGKRPFELGDVKYADGTDIPLDRIKAPSNGLYTYVNMPQNLP